MACWSGNRLEGTSYDRACVENQRTGLLMLPELTSGRHAENGMRLIV
jgi:hypothetical protein